MISIATSLKLVLSLANTLAKMAHDRKQIGLGEMKAINYAYRETEKRIGLARDARRAAAGKLPDNDKYDRG